MLVTSLDVDWRDVEPSWLDKARSLAADSGDLPRLSAVDLDVLALLLGSRCHYTQMIIAYRTQCKKQVLRHNQ